MTGADQTPRISPGGRRDIGLANWTMISAGARVAKVPGLPHLFTTMARHRSLFRAWLFFAGRLMPRGKLPRRETELVILRVAHLCDAPYERAHHERIGVRAGLSRDQIAALSIDDPPSSAFSERQRAIVTAVDELVSRHGLADATWDRLVGVGLSERQLIELPMLTGHYTMLAMTLNALRVQPDTFRRR